MSRGAILWKRVLTRHRDLAAAAETFSDDSEVESGDDLADDDPFADFNPEFDDESCDDPTDDDPFADFNPEFDDEDPESAADDEQNDSLLESRIEGVPKNKPLVASMPVPVVNKTFEDAADLWLTQSHTALEHALLSMGLTRDVFPTKCPLLVFGSHRTGLAMPEYHRVEVKREGWPPCLYSTERLSSTDAAKILASSASITDPTCFEGETVAVEVPNPLLADDRWIVIWPELESLPERQREEPQWGQVRRVVWCVNRDQIGPRDLLDWLSRFWQDTPVRIALFRAASFAREEQDGFAQSKVLPNVRRTLEKFDVIKGHPWIVVGP